MPRAIITITFCVAIMGFAGFGAGSAVKACDLGGSRAGDGYEVPGPAESGLSDGAFTLYRLDSPGPEYRLEPV